MGKIAKLAKMARKKITKMDKMAKIANIAWHELMARMKIQIVYMPTMTYMLDKIRRKQFCNYTEYIRRIF